MLSATNSSGRSACVFCGSASDKLTNEHVFRRAFKKSFLNAPGLTFTHHGEGLAETVRRPISQFDMTVRIVCGRCNEGWLNDLESRAWPSIAALTGSGPKAPLDEDASTTLAFWAFVRALVRTHVSPQGRAPRHLFEQARADLVVPPSARVQAAFCTHSVLEAGSHLSARLGSPVEHDIWQVSFGLGPVFLTATFENPHCEESRGLAAKVAQRPAVWFPNAFRSLDREGAAGEPPRILGPEEAIVSASALSIALGQPRVMNQMGTTVDHLAVIPAQFHDFLVL